MDRVAPVAEDLNLDMAGARDEFLQIEAAVAERGFRFGAGLIERGLDAFIALDDANAASARAVGRSAMRPSEPGTTGTPAALAAARAAALSPMARIVSPFGPTNTRPAASTASAKAAFSERKP